MGQTPLPSMYRNNLQMYRIMCFIDQAKVTNGSLCRCGRPCHWLCWSTSSMHNAGTWRSFDKAMSSVIRRLVQPLMSKPKVSNLPNGVWLGVKWWRNFFYADSEPRFQYSSQKERRDVVALDPQQFNSCRGSHTTYFVCADVAVLTNIMNAQFFLGPAGSGKCMQPMRNLSCCQYAHSARFLCFRSTLSPAQQRFEYSCLGHEKMVPAASSTFIVDKTKRFDVTIAQQSRSVLIWPYLGNDAICTGTSENLGFGHATCSRCGSMMTCACLEASFSIILCRAVQGLNNA